MNIEVCHHCKNTIQPDTRDAVITSEGRIYCRKCITEEIAFLKVCLNEMQKAKK
jgi:hypothetical protein